jgi:hypothetical protein
MIQIGTVAKSVSFTYDTESITGDSVTIFAKNAAHENIEPREKKTVPNDGAFALAFPMNYSGEVFIEIHGSDEGEDTATLQIGEASEAPPVGGDESVVEHPDELPPAPNQDLPGSEEQPV